MLRGLRKNGAAVINADDERCVRQLEESPAARQLSYGFRASARKAGQHYRILAQDSLGGGSTRVRIERPDAALLDVRSPLLGAPGAYALAAALASVETLLGRSLSGEEVESALAAITVRPPDLILLDLGLSDGDGSAVAEHVATRAATMTAFIVRRHALLHLPPWIPVRNECTVPAYESVR